MSRRSGVAAKADSQSKSSHSELARIAVTAYAPVSQGESRAAVRFERYLKSGSGRVFAKRDFA